MSRNRSQLETVGVGVAQDMLLDLRDLPDEEELLGPLKMRKYVDLSASMLRNQAQEGRLPHVRMGRRYLFPKKTLLRFLQRRALEAVHDYDDHP